jgi:hypothetical protein
VGHDTGRKLLDNGVASTAALDDSRPVLAGDDCDGEGSLTRPIRRSRLPYGPRPIPKSYLVTATD